MSQSKSMSYPPIGHEHLRASVALWCWTAKLPSNQNDVKEGNVRELSQALQKQISVGRSIHDFATNSVHDGPEHLPLAKSYTVIIRKMGHVEPNETPALRPWG